MGSPSVKSDATIDANGLVVAGTNTSAPATGAPVPFSFTTPTSWTAAEASKAYFGGNASQAYNLAVASLKVSRNGLALEIKTLAACKLKRADAAKSAYKGLSKGTKKTVRKKCKDMGVRLPLL